MILDLSRHPIGFVVNLCKIFPEICGVELSVYRHVPQTTADRRRVVCVPASNLRSNVSAILKSLRPQEEIAFHSRVYVRALFRKRIFHVPMIDFKGELDDCQVGQGIEVARSVDCLSAAIFSSGRSYHLYGMSLLSEEEWIKFMGRILLLNPPNGPDLVDARWVGHRLLAGYASLRWSKNTSFYKNLPELVREEALAEYPLARPKLVPAHS